MNPYILNTLQTLVNQNTTEKLNWKAKKLDLPSFVEENPKGWILQVERYFEFYQLTDKEVREVAVLSLVGESTTVVSMGALITTNIKVGRIEGVASKAISVH